MENSQNLLKKITSEIVTRKSAYNFNSFTSFLPDPDFVLRREGTDITVYKEFLADSHVWACVQSRKAGTLSLEWEIGRGKDKTEQTKIIENIFKSIDFYSIISEILNAPLFGFQPMEIIWQKRNNLILPIDIKAKPQEWFCFDDNNILRFRSKENYYGEELPDRKFLCPQSNPTYVNPYGERALSRIFWNVSFKKGGSRFWIKFVEKYGMPFLIGKNPRETPEISDDEMIQMLEKMVQDAVGVIPDDSSIEILESKNSSSGEVYEKLIDKMNSEISKAILGQTLTTEIGSTGSYAASNTHMNVRKDIIDADKKLVEKTLNQLIQWIYEINFSPQQDIPTFEMYEEEDVDLTLSQRDKILSETGVKFTKEYFKKTYGFDDEDFEIQGEPSVKKNTFSEFKQIEHIYQDQKIVDNFIDSFSDKDLQKQSESILSLMLKIINDCSSYNEVYERLSEKGLNTNEIENVLQKIFFVSETWGRLNGND